MKQNFNETKFTILSILHKNKYNKQWHQSKKFEQIDRYLKCEIKIGIDYCRVLLYNCEECIIVGII